MTPFFVQITADGQGNLYALSKDGTVWHFLRAHQKWWPLPAEVLE